MAVENVSRIAALLAVDANALNDFLNSETARISFIEGYQKRGEIDANEVATLSSGDMTEIFNYLNAHLPRPAGEDEDPGG